MHMSVCFAINNENRGGSQTFLCPLRTQIWPERQRPVFKLRLIRLSFKAATSSEPGVRFTICR